MKKFIVSLIVVISLIVCAISCTENQRARTFGGDITIEVPSGKKVTMATWKGEDLFYMIEDMDSNYIPKTKELIESSSWGVVESKVIFNESR